ncbi:MAG: M23 family metallopeptidase [Clostridia bacterium]|nr:M23 family metallopeptidase [Clostridia bacterium]
MEENREKDYYLAVLLVQILVCVLFSVLVYLFGTEGDFKSAYLSVINKQMDSFELTSAVETFRKHLYTGEIFTVLNINDDYRQNEAIPTADDTVYETTEAMGGEDLEFRKAADNTSFAPVLSTSEIYNPVENGRYTSYFGYRINPISGEYGFHTGVDIAAAEGTDIRAAFSGTVLKTGTDEKAGKYIYLSHNDGFITFYCHCSDILVEEGTVIRQGEAIALVGSTGYSTGPHLHFEIRKDNIRYNPMWLLKK